MRIYLGDLFYVKDDSKGIPVPLNVGLIASYVKTRNCDLEITLFKDPMKMYRAVEACQPDLIGLSNYSWNSNLNIALMLELTKSAPGVPVVMGGPNFPSESPDRIDTFFKNRPFISAYVNGEGETGFAYIIDHVKNHGSLANFIQDAPRNFWVFDSTNGHVVRGSDASLERVDLDAVPSPYLSGMLDEFLDEGPFSPIFETNRGCPYSCSFCVWGQATESKVRANNIERIKEELRYCALKPNLAGELAFFADANFGILTRDVEIAEEILACHREHDFPNRLYIYFAKNPASRGLKCAEILAPLTDMTLSRQSMNPEALTNVRRQNMNIAKFEDTIKAVKANGAATGTEMIYGLPGETYRSYVDGIIELSESAQFIQQYALLLMWGSELSTDIYRKIHGIKGSWRPIHDCWADFGPFASVEFEEVVTTTNHMNASDWKRIRLFHIFTQYLYSDVFKRFREQLGDASVNLIEFAERFMDDHSNWPPSFRRVVDAIRQQIDDEFIAEDDPRFQEHELVQFNDKHTVERLEGEFYALAPFFKSMLHSDSQTLDDLFGYLRSAVVRWYGGSASDDTIETLRHELTIARALSISYDELARHKQVQVGDISLSLSMNGRIADALSKIVRGAPDAAYKLKMEYVVSSRDKAFCYECGHAYLYERDLLRQGVTIAQTDK